MMKMIMIPVPILSVSHNACTVPINNSLHLPSVLADSTLEQIEMEHKGNVTLCMNDMLTAWLLQRDNVSWIGTPSLSVLKSALEEIGEKGIDGEMLSICYCMHMHMLFINNIWSKIIIEMCTISYSPSILFYCMSSTQDHLCKEKACLPKL